MNRARASNVLVDSNAVNAVEEPFHDSTQRTRCNFSVRRNRTDADEHRFGAGHRSAGIERRDTFFAEFKQMIRSRSHLLPYHDASRRKCAAPDRPSELASQCEPDYDAQIEHVALPAPGDMLQLEQTVAELHARPLDRARPLWKIYYIDGLAGGRSCVFQCRPSRVPRWTRRTNGGRGAHRRRALPSANDRVPRQSPLHRRARRCCRTDHRRCAKRRCVGCGSANGGWRRVNRATPSALAPSTPLNRAIGAARAYALLRDIDERRKSDRQERTGVRSTTYS